MWSCQLAPVANIFKAKCYFSDYVVTCSLCWPGEVHELLLKVAKGLHKIMLAKLFHNGVENTGENVILHVTLWRICSNLILYKIGQDGIQPTLLIFPGSCFDLSVSLSP